MQREESSCIKKVACLVLFFPWNLEQVSCSQRKLEYYQLHLLAISFTIRLRQINHDNGQRGSITCTN